MRMLLQGTGALGRRRLLALLAAGLSLAGCSEEGNGKALGTVDAAGAPADATADVQTGPSFESDSTGQGPRVDLEGSVSADGRVVVRVFVRDVAKLYGIAGQLVYDPAALEVVESKAFPMMSSADGTILGRSVIGPGPGGRLLLGAARFRQTPGWKERAAAKVGNEIWAEITFAPRLPGQHGLSFDPLTTLARDETYKRLDLSWNGATIRMPGGGR